MNHEADKPVRQINAQTLIPLGAAVVLATAMAGLVPLAIAYGAERAALAARLSELERNAADRDRRLEALRGQLNTMERSLWRIEGKLGTLPSAPADTPEAHNP
jgi:hypothetical protein